MAENRAADATKTIIHYQDEPTLPPPALEVGVPAWLRQNLFGSPADIVVTILSSLLLLVLVFGFFDWALRSANWFAIINNQRFFMMQSFEREFEWRIALTVLFSALLTGVSFAAWARKSMRKLTTITLAVIVVIVVLPAVIDATVPQPNSYLTAGNVEIVDRASTLTPQENLAFIAQAGETVSLQLAIDEVADVETLSELAGFSDRAANALANASRNRLEQQAKNGEAFDSMISGELTEDQEERMRLVIRTYTRTNDMQASTIDYVASVGERLSDSGASIGQVKLWLNRLEAAANSLDEREDAVISAIEAVEDTVANLTSDSSITTDIGGAIVALTETLLNSEQIEELGELLVLYLSEDLIGERDQSDDDEELIQPSQWEAAFLRDMFVRLLAPKSVVDIYDLGQTPIQVAIRDAQSFEVLSDGVLTAAGESVSFLIPQDGWYILSKTAAEGAEGTTLLAVQGIFPIVERTLSATLSQFVRLTDNQLEIFGRRPEIDGKPASIIALIDNQFRGLRELQVYLVHFVPLFFQQVQALLLPFFITIAWGFALGRALAHLLGENTIFNSNNSRAAVLGWSMSPLLILLLYFALLDGGRLITGLPAIVLKLAAVFAAVELARRMDRWLQLANSREDAEAPITRQLMYGWGIYPIAMFVLVSGIGGLSGATVGSMAGGLIWLLLMFLVGINFQGKLGYALLAGGFFLQIVQASVINTVWNGWTQDPVESLVIWLLLAAVGIGLGLLGASRRGSFDQTSKRVGYLISCIVFLFVFVNTDQLRLVENSTTSVLIAVAIVLWLVWMFFTGVVKWTSNRIIIGLLLMTFLWMQIWTGVDRWSIIYFTIWLGAGALAFKRGDVAQRDLRKESASESESLLSRYPLHLTGLAALAWLISLLIIPSFVLGLEALGVLRASPDDLLPLSDKRLWGGLMLTMQLTILGIVAAFPIGLALALGRRSKLTVVKYACTLFIETVRGVPLITVLFMATLLLPLIDPTLASVENAVRAWVGITLFSAAYLAENVRGGLQSVDRGQTEAAQAIGLSGWHTTLYILLPQALRAVIPALVGQFISLFKDTSLVSIVGLAEITGIAGRVVAQGEFLGRRQETFLYVAMIYFVFSYIMSYVSRRVEATGSGAARAQQL